MVEFLSLIILIITALLSLIAFFVAISLLFPNRLAKTRVVAGHMPGRTFLVGVVNFAFFATFALAFFALGNWLAADFLALVGMLLLMIPTIGAVLGLGGVVDLVGERLVPKANPVVRTILSSLTLSLACALPFIGWFVLLPYLSLLGLGAFISSFFRREEQISETDHKEQG